MLQEIKIMKILKFVFCSLLFCSSLNVFAQEDLATKAAKQTDRMKIELSLTEEQVAKVNDINYGILLKNEDLKNDDTLTQEDRKTLIKSNEDEKLLMFKSILTAEQYDLYLSKPSSMRKNTGLEMKASPAKFQIQTN